MADFKTIDEKAFQEAQARGSSRPEPRAISASFAEKQHRIVVEVETCAVFRFDPSLVHELRGASNEDLDAVEVTGAGYGIYFPHRDLDVSIARVQELARVTEGAFNT